MMRRSMWIITTAFIMISYVSSAAYDCNRAPTITTQIPWCQFCVYRQTEVYCNSCISSIIWHINAEKSNCVKDDCTNPQTPFTSSWCLNCELTKKQVAADNMSCEDPVFDCKVKPVSQQLLSLWCKACSTISTEIVCQTCQSWHANYDSTICTQNDCSVTPTIYTTSWCSSCQKVNQTAALDEKSCVNIDCSVKPTNNYSHDWCNSCISPPTLALSDKSGCKSTKSLILSFIYASLLVFIAIV